MCRCSAGTQSNACKFRKLTDKNRLLGTCIHGKPGAKYDPKHGFTISPNCEHCNALLAALPKGATA